MPVNDCLPYRPNRVYSVGSLAALHLLNVKGKAFKLRSLLVLLLPVDHVPQPCTDFGHQAFPPRYT